jgi:hypothetical protein
VRNANRALPQYGRRLNPTVDGFAVPLLASEAVAYDEKADAVELGGKTLSGIKKNRMTLPSIYPAHQSKNRVSGGCPDERA